MRPPIQFSSQLELLCLISEEVRPPALQTDIEECENFIKRRLPSSYRNFLRIHNGLVNYSGSMRLFGTEDYFSSQMSSEFVEYVKAFCHARGFINYIFMDTKDFGFDSIYKINEEGEILSKLQSEYKNFCKNFDNSNDNLFWPMHTLIGMDTGNGILLVADYNSKELIYEVRAEGVTGEYSSFYEWVSDEYAFNVDDLS